MNRRPGFRFNRGRIATGGGLSRGDFSQTSNVEVAATALGVADFSQVSNVEAVAALSLLIPAQLDVEIGNSVITLGGTMRLTGTSPVITPTGSLTFGAGLVPGIKLTVLPGGITCDVSYNSGSTTALAGATLTPGGTLALNGAASGVTLNFAAGVYVAGDTYEGTVATLLSSEGSSYTFTQGVAATQPVFRHRAVTPDAKDATFHVNPPGAGQWLASTDAAVVALFTDDPALTVFGRVGYTSQDFTGAWLCAASSALNDIRQRVFEQSSSSTGKEFHFAINNAGTTTSNLDTTTPITGLTNAHTLCYYFPGSNGGANIEVNGSAEAFTSATFNPGTLTPTRVAIGGRADSAPTEGMNGYIYRITVFSSALGTSDRAAWTTEMAT